MRDGDGTYDAIVVGARVAGAPTAMLLARQGRRVLLLDRGRFPSDIRTSTLLIWPPGIGYLKKWGVLETLVATGCPPIDRYRISIGPPFGEPAITIVGAPRTSDECLGGTTSYAPRRTILDEILVKEAVRAGAALREEVTVTDLLRDGDRVVGIRGRDASGAPIEARADVVVGADGSNSVVARLTNAETYDTHDPIVTTFYTYWRGLELADGCQFEVAAQDWGGIYAWPTHAGLTLVGANFARPLNGEIPAPGRAYAPAHANWQEEYERVKASAEAFYMGMLDQAAPWLARQCRASATREAPFVGGAVHNFYRKPYGPGWALVGDAGGSYEFSTAHGITNAFREADVLAEALGGASSRLDGSAERLAAFHARRDAAEVPFSRFTMAQASFQPVPDPAAAGALFGAIARDAQATRDFLGLFAETHQPAAFFAEDHLADLMRRAS
jgi:flavin-dependent dehydrogenase